MARNRDLDPRARVLRVSDAIRGCGVDKAEGKIMILKKRRMNKMVKVLFHLIRVSLECGLCWKVYTETGTWTVLFAVLTVSGIELIGIILKMQHQVNKEGIDILRKLAKKDGKD